MPAKRRQAISSPVRLAARFRLGENEKITWAEAGELGGELRENRETSRQETRARTNPQPPSRLEFAGGWFRVAEGIRTPDFQNHNLAL